jgi:hypothetical protein
MKRLRGTFFDVKLILTFRSSNGPFFVIDRSAYSSSVFANDGWTSPGGQDHIAGYQASDPTYSRNNDLLDS